MNEFDFDDIFTSVQTEPGPEPEEPFDLDTWKEKKQADRQQVYNMANDTTMTEQMAGNLEAEMKVVTWDPMPYPRFMLTNNNAEMHRLEKRIEQLKNERDAGFVGWEFDGGEAVANTEKRRLQLFFDEKPDEDQRTILKRYGFRWTPTEGAWQRLLNDNAIYACDRIDFLRPTDGQRPTQLQPKAPRSAEMER